MVRESFSHFPTVEETKKKRAELLQELYAEPVCLKRLIKDIQHSYTKEFATLIGSVDFAEERLAALLAALEELAEEIEAPGEKLIEEIQESIRQDSRIDEVFEDFVLACAKISLN